jgi:hypothetical protein
MDEIAKLLAIEAIRNLKAAYFRCMDTKNWSELEDLFTQDALFDVRGALEIQKPEEQYANEAPIRGARSIVEYIRAGLTPLRSVHHGHAPEIEITSASSARATWPMSDLLIAPAGGPFRSFRGYGYYWETYSCQDGAWRIATLRLRRLHVETD